MEWSEQRLVRMHDRLARHGGAVPGLVALVSRGDDVRVDAIGTMAADSTEAIGPDAIFRISSMTKPITGAATMVLVEDGTIRLDDPVDDLLPELADMRVLRALDGPVDDTVPAERPITVRDLLTFRLGTGGLFAPPGTYPIQEAMDRAGLGAGPPSPQGTPAPDDWIERLGSLPLLEQPGTRWRYHTGADVLGVLIARASGEPFGQLLRRRLFEPLGMVDTGFFVPEDQRHRLTTHHWTDPGDGSLTVADEPDGQWSRPPAFEGGGAGLVSTAHDYHAFARMLLAGGRHGDDRILSRASIELMTSDQLTAAQKAASDSLVPEFWDRFGWGFLCSVVLRRDGLDGSVGSVTWDGGMGTTWLNDPVEELVLILMTTAAWTSPVPPPVAVDFRALAYAAVS